MNFEFEIKMAKQDAEAALRRAEALAAKHKEAKKFTTRFLAECKKAKIERVSIGRKHDSIPSAKNWPFGHAHNVFAFGERGENTWPPIWGVCERLGIANGCGNSDQRQADTSNLIDGVYHLKDGQWLRIDNEAAG